MLVPTFPTETIGLWVGGLIISVGSGCAAIRYFATEIRETLKALRGPEDNPPPGDRGGTP